MLKKMMLSNCAVSQARIAHHHQHNNRASVWIIGLMQGWKPEPRRATLTNQKASKGVYLFLISCHVSVTLMGKFRRSGVKWKNLTSLRMPWRQLSVKPSIETLFGNNRPVFYWGSKDHNWVSLRAVEPQGFKKVPQCCVGCMLLFSVKKTTLYSPSCYSWLVLF